MGSTAQCVEVRRKDPSCQSQTVDGQMGVGFVNDTHAPLHAAIDGRTAFSAGFSKGNKLQSQVHPPGRSPPRMNTPPYSLVRR